MTIRTYRTMLTYDTFADRFKYLALSGSVAAHTFGYDRHVNQNFYRSRQWKQVREFVIARDLGCDLGVEGYEIYNGLYIHHMNPMTVNDIISDSDAILDPEYLITTTHVTHNAIHYGDERQLPRSFEPRKPGDTKLW